MVNEKSSAVGVNIQEKATEIHTDNIDAEKLLHENFLESLEPQCDDMNKRIISKIKVVSDNSKTILLESK